MDQKNHACELRMHRSHAYETVLVSGVWKNGGTEIIAGNQRNRNCQDADVQPIVRDPMDDEQDFCRIKSRDDPCST